MKRGAREGDGAQESLSLVGDFLQGLIDDDSGQRRKGKARRMMVGLPFVASPSATLFLFDPQSLFLPLSLWPLLSARDPRSCL